MKSKTNKSIFILSVIVATIILFPYILVFQGTPLSQSTIDWGAFGNYAGISISILSITLIYITYNEQKQSNRIARFEQHFNTMISTLSNFYERNSDIFEHTYERFCQHFVNQSYDLSKCEQSKTIIVCEYYYSSIFNDTSIDFNNIFHYVNITIDFINNNAITDNEKKCRITELICIIPESLRVLFLYWILQNKIDKKKYYYEVGIFYINGENNYFLKDIITFICTGNVPRRRDSEIIDSRNFEFEFKDYSNEHFHDTYDRFFNNKKSNNNEK